MHIDMGNEFEMKASNTYADVFAVTAITGGWNKKNSKIEITGNLFSSIAHFDASDSSAKIYMNDETNKTGFEANIEAKGYTIVDADQLSDINSVLGSVKGNLGFDIGAKYQRDLFRFLTVGGSAQIPIVPSKLSVGYSVEYNYNKEFDLNTLIGKESDSSESTETAAEKPKQEEEEEEDTSFLGKPTILTTPYAIHRPLKLGVSADFHPFGTLLTTSGYLGIAFRHPFASAINKANGGENETHFYVDYSIAGRVSLWNILSLSLSHSYLDEIFKNEIALALNIRLAEVDAGVSFQSPTFVKSFSGAGIGAFVTVCIGF